MNNRNHALSIFLIIGLSLVLSLCPLLPVRYSRACLPGEEPSAGTSVEDARLTQALVAEGNGTVTQHYGFSPLWGWQDQILVAAAEGTEILAARPGTVVFVGEIGKDSGFARAPFGYGLVLRHDDGLLSVYAHCKQVLVEEGQRIAAGEPLASVKKPEEENQGPYFLFRLQDEKNNSLPPSLLLRY